ncbi:MAG TPA: hypothetical protein VJ816_11300 [Gemmatimonadales bacterium]|nr:hypothetical protein [Gemmatimonadales bacterium]
MPERAAEPGRSVARPAQAEPLGPAAWSAVASSGEAPSVEAPSTALVAAVDLVPAAEQTVPVAPMGA